jgi:Enoyl-(Acyl carrier protein) reductase
LTSSGDRPHPTGRRVLRAVPRPRARGRACGHGRGERRTWLFCHAISTRADCLICSTFFRRLIIDAGEDPDALERDERSAGNLLPIPWIEPGDVAEAVRFLVSDRARYMTGTTLVIDAGLLTR